MMKNDCLFVVNRLRKNNYGTENLDSFFFIKCRYIRRVPDVFATSRLQTLSYRSVGEANVGNES